MKRDFAGLAQSVFDVAIIGGGITGACIARDAARRGFSVAMVEKRDFSCGTSAGSTKLVHGGLRYLKTMEFSLIRESLRERRIWERIAPHMVYPMPFLLPLRKASEKWVIGTGLTLYDWLSYDRNWLDDPDQRIPGHRSISADEARRIEPVLGNARIDGAMVYHDCQMYSPERLGLECIIDAVAHGARAVNYAEAVGFSRKDGGIGAIRVRDAIGGEETEIKARIVINAAGPWADRLLELIEGGQTSHKLIRSKGIHIVTAPVTRSHALAVSQKGGHFFIVPWRGHSIIGTTDTVYKGAPDALTVGEAEVRDFLAFVNDGLPGLNVGMDQVRYAYAGLRPLVDDGATSSYNASRRAEIVDHGAEGGPDNLLSAIGGKWTTSREIAEKAVNLVARKLGAGARACDTAEVPLPGANGRFRNSVERLVAGNPTLAASTLSNLARNYGAMSSKVLDLARADTSLARPVSQSHPDIAAQVVHAVDMEMAMTLDDVVFRRTGLGTLGRIETHALADIARLMGARLGWSDAEQQRQIASIAWRHEAVAGVS